MKKAKFLSGIIVLSLVFVSIFSMVGCQPKAGNGVHTYNEYISQSPTSWNSHIGTSDADTYVQQYTEMGLYDITLSADRTTYAFIDEMATGDPVDVTANYVGKYEIKSGETGKAYKINLNQDATWANGVKITSADYLYSMEQLLSPQMKNSKASAYYTGTSEIYNAKNYYMNTGNEVREYTKIPSTETLDEVEINDMIARGELYFSLTEIPIMDGLSSASFSLKAYFEQSEEKRHDPTMTTWIKNYTYFFPNQDITGTSIIETLSAEKYTPNADLYVKITRENLEEVKTSLHVFEGNLSVIPNWYNLCARGKSTTTVYNKIAKATTYTDQEINEFIESGKLYFSLTEIPIMDGLPTASFSLKAYFEQSEEKRHDPTMTTWIKNYTYFFPNQDITGTSIIETLSAPKYAPNVAGYVKVTKENLEEVKASLHVFEGNLASIPNWYNLCALQEEEGLSPAEFNEVGIEAVDEYSLVIVFKRSLSMFDVKYALTSNWLVYKDLYEAGKQQQGSITVTNYGTSIDNYMAYGPYKLATYQKDKELTFERNENWYGYKQGATNYHEGQFQTDRIVTQVIKESGTALLEFENGNLDQVRLGSNDLEKYKFSDYLLKRVGGNIWQIGFNSDVDALKSIEDKEKDGNRRILSVTEFRKALSLCLDRSVIGREIAAGSESAFAYINDNYFYDMQNNSNSVYRTSEDGMRAIVDLYGIEYGEGKTYATLADAYKAVTGYDIDQAKADFLTAVDKAVAQGIYSEGDKIKINIYTNDLTATRSAIGQNMQKQVNLATQGTKLEGKITIEWKEQQQNRNEDLSQGKIEASFYSTIADYSDPYALLGTYIDEVENEYLIEYGFDPKVEKFALTYDFDGDGADETVEMTYADWQKSISAGGKYAKDVNTRLYVTARLEYQLLSTFQSIPLYVGADVTLRSKKVNYATENANIFAVYGGVRLMTYNYDDAEWANYCKKHTLNYAE